MDTTGLAYRSKDRPLRFRRGKEVRRLRGHARLLAMRRWDRGRRLLWPWGGVAGEGYAPDPWLGGEVLRFIWGRGPKAAVSSFPEVLLGEGKAGILSATLSREVDRPYMSLTCEVGRPEPGRKEVKGPEDVVGIDLGLSSFAVLSDGTWIEAPKPLAKALRLLRRRSRQLARKEKGSPFPGKGQGPPPVPKHLKGHLVDLLQELGAQELRRGPMGQKPSSLEENQPVREKGG